MKFTHILKAWLAYILYWHSGNMFPLPLYLSFFVFSLSVPSLFPFPLFLLLSDSSLFCVCVALWGSAVLCPVIFICKTCGRHIAVISKKKNIATDNWIFMSHFVLHFHSSDELLIYAVHSCTVKMQQSDIEQHFGGTKVLLNVIFLHKFWTLEHWSMICLFVYQHYYWR